MMLAQTESTCPLLNFVHSYSARISLVYHYVYLPIFLIRKKNYMDCCELYSINYHSNFIYSILYHIWSEARTPNLSMI